MFQYNSAENTHMSSIKGDALPRGATGASLTPPMGAALHVSIAIIMKQHPDVLTVAYMDN